MKFDAKNILQLCVVLIDVAIVFNGLVRSLKYTIDNLQENVFGILKQHNMSYHIYMHTYTLSRPYSNERNRMRSITVQSDQYKLMNADFLLVDDQDTVVTMLNVTKYRTHGNPWGSTSPHWQSHTNFILAMYSRYLITKELDKNVNVKHLFNYKYTMFIRSDVWFPRPFDISYFDLLKNENDYLSPNWHKYATGNRQKVNDRFGLCHTKLGIDYGLEFDLLYNFSKHYAAHSESFKSYVLEYYHANIIEIGFVFGRVRPNGGIDSRDRRCCPQYKNVISQQYLKMQNESLLNLFEVAVT